MGQLFKGRPHRRGTAITGGNHPPIRRNDISACGLAGRVLPRKSVLLSERQHGLRSGKLSACGFRHEHRTHAVSLPVQLSESHDSQRRGQWHPNQFYVGAAGRAVCATGARNREGIGTRFATETPRAACLPHIPRRTARVGQSRHSVAA